MKKATVLRYGVIGNLHIRVKVPRDFKTFEHSVGISYLNLCKCKLLWRYNILWFIVRICRYIVYLLTFKCYRAKNFNRNWITFARYITMVLQTRFVRFIFHKYLGYCQENGLAEESVHRGGSDGESRDCGKVQINKGTHAMRSSQITKSHK